VLVAEDNAALLSLIARQLVEAGAEVVTADNGAVALEALAERGHVDVILSDLRMPVMDGIELSRALAERAPSVPIVFMTGYADSDLLDEGGLRAASVLLKPFRFEDLLTALVAAIPGLDREHVG
jgi:CheY-like chemotaxis protein